MGYEEHGIIFSAPMVRATLDRRKTQTRRAVTLEIPSDTAEVFAWFRPDSVPDEQCAEQGLYCWTGNGLLKYLGKCPYGVPGDRLWVLEDWQHDDTCCDDHKCGQPSHIYYRATEVAPECIRWRSALSMPRWASRIDLEIIAIGVQSNVGWDANPWVWVITHAVV
jgi:hypothetical protein